MSLKTAFTKDIDKYWTVTTTQRVGSYGQTQSLGVVAKTATDAISKTITKYPNVTVTACNHKGAVDIV
jgi:hypothetical protein